MGLFTDVKRDIDGYTFRAKFTHYFSPKIWLQHYKWRKQRADRGWSDRDMWGMGEHMAQITVEMLKELKEGMTDWDAWFKYNIREEGKGAYKNIQDVIDDIENYLIFERTSWTDDLKYTAGKTGKYSISWVNEKGNKVTEAEITHRINKYHKELTKRYKKAQKAMGFFGRHFAQFWD